MLVIKLTLHLSTTFPASCYLLHRHDAPPPHTISQPHHPHHIIASTNPNQPCLTPQYITSLLPHSSHHRPSIPLTLHHTPVLHLSPPLQCLPALSLSLSLALSPPLSPSSTQTKFNVWCHSLMTGATKFITTRWAETEPIKEPSGASQVMTRARQQH